MTHFECDLSAAETELRYSIEPVTRSTNRIPINKGLANQTR